MIFEPSDWCVILWLTGASWLNDSLLLPADRGCRCRDDHPMKPPEDEEPSGSYQHRQQHSGASTSPYLIRDVFGTHVERADMFLVPAALRWTLANALSWCIMSDTWEGRRELAADNIFPTYPDQEGESVLRIMRTHMTITSVEVHYTALLNLENHDFFA